MRTLLIVLAATTVACGGAVRDYPRWQLTDEALTRSGCVIGRAFVRMSGKTGVGITLQLRSTEDCQVRIARAELVLDGERAPARLPAPLALRGRSQVYVWLPFEFDNDAAWNDGKRAGTFEIDLETNGATATWRMPAEHRFRRWRPEPRW